MNKDNKTDVIPELDENRLEKVSGGPEERAIMGLKSISECRICEKCGTVNDMDAKICRVCGEKL